MSDDALIERYIGPNPHRPGVEHAVEEGGVSVWALVAHWRRVGENVRQVAADYDLPTEAVKAALAYYRRHAAAIEARIAANAA